LNCYEFMYRFPSTDNVEWFPSMSSLCATREEDASLLTWTATCKACGAADITLGTIVSATTAAAGAAAVGLLVSMSAAALLPARAAATAGPVATSEREHCCISVAAEAAASITVPTAELVAGRRRVLKSGAWSILDFWNIPRSHGSLYSMPSRAQMSRSVAHGRSSLRDRILLFSPRVQRIKP
jgi:hypothetical protein